MIRRSGSSTYHENNVETLTKKNQLKSSLPSSMPRRKIAHKIPSSFLKQYMLLSVVLTLCLLFLPHYELDVNPHKNIEVINRMDTTAYVKVEDVENSINDKTKTETESQLQQQPEAEQTDFDNQLARNIVAARLGTLEVLPQEQLDSKKNTTNISLVISHCEEKVHWIARYVGNKYKIKDIVVYSKCGKQVRGVHKLAQLAHTQVIRLENIGRCDHTYAYWIKEHYNGIIKERDGDDIVLFLKDSKRYRNMYRSFDEIFTYTTETGFACLKKPECDCYKPCNRGKVSPVMMHQKSYLMDFSLHEYSRIARDENSEFLSDKYTSLDVWNKAMGFHIPEAETIPVCYFGMFAVQKKYILNQPAFVWERVTNSLSRANNIIEGHYAERMWAPLLSNPDERYAREVDKALLPRVKLMVTRPTNGIVCGMAAMYYVERGETFDNYFK